MLTEAIFQLIVSRTRDSLGIDLNSLEFGDSCQQSPRVRRAGSLSAITCLAKLVQVTLGIRYFQLNPCFFRRFVGNLGEVENAIFLAVKCFVA